MSHLYELYIEASLYFGKSTDFILWVNGIFSLFIAFVFGTLYWTTLRGERWLWLLTGSFLLGALASLLYLIDDQWIWMHTAILAQSLFLLWSARSLQSFGTLGSVEHARRKSNNLYWLRKESLFILAFLLAFIFQWNAKATVPFQRVPEGILTLICTVIFIQAMGAPLKRKGTTSNAIKAFCYILIVGFVLRSISFMVNPLLANKQMGFGIDVARVYLPVLEAMDGFTLVITIVLTFLLFLVILILIGYASQVLAPDPNLLADMCFGNTEYLDPESKGGLLAAVGCTVDADYAELIVRRPGRHLQNKMHWWGWFNEDFRKNHVTPEFLAQNKREQEETGNPFFLDKDASSPKAFPLPDENKTVCGNIFRDGHFEVCNDLTSNETGLFQRFVPNTRSYVCVPVKFHGAVIAVLNIESLRKKAFSSTTVRSVRLMARYLAPAIHARRELEALSALSLKLSKIANEGLPTQALFNKAVRQVHDILEPVATVFSFPFGFHKVVVSCHQTSDGKTIGPHHRHFATSSSDAIEERFSRINKLYQDKLEFHHELPGDDDEQSLVSYLILATHLIDPLFQPALGREAFLRRTVTAMLQSTIIEAAEAQFSKALNDLQEALADDTVSNPQKWFEAVDQVVKDNQIQWACGRMMRPDARRYLGPATLKERLRTYYEGYRGAKGNIDVFAANEPIEGANSIICIALPQSKSELWLGVEAADFEKSFDLEHSPWLTFLGRLGTTADYALAQIEYELLKELTTDLELKAQRSIQQTLWLHEIGNKAGEIRTGAGLAMESVHAGLSNRALDLMERLGDSALQLSTLTKEVIRPFDLKDEREEFPLIDVIKNVVTFHKAMLESRGIVLHNLVNPNLQVVIRYRIAFLVISNLVSNAIKALKRSKQRVITIQAEPYGDEKIQCHISDTGPGVPKDIRMQIFSPGFSTDRNHSGAGLPVSRDALKKMEGDLQLDEKYAPGARFSITFPSVAKDSIRRQP